MTLLEVVTEASSIYTAWGSEKFDYPIVLNAEPIFPDLTPETVELDAEQPLKKVTGWEIYQTDLELIKIGGKFCEKLGRKLKNTSSFGKSEFLEMLCSLLLKVGDKVGISVKQNYIEEGYACKLIEKVGTSVGRDVRRSILEACILEVWSVLERLITCGLIEHFCTPNLIYNLIEKRRSDVIVLCVKHLMDLQTYELMCILKYFLVLPSDGYKSLVIVREDWENQALLAIEKASGKGISGKEQSLAKDAALLVMLAHDEFSASELCLHYLLASRHFDEVIFSACIGKLNAEETKALVKYLGKWLKKHERFPQAGPCPKASAVLSRKVCDWIPALETVVKCLGLVVDELFSSLALHSDLHEELISFEEVISSLAAEARFCATLTCTTERLRNELTGAHPTERCALLPRCFFSGRDSTSIPLIYRPNGNGYRGKIPNKYWSVCRTRCCSLLSLSRPILFGPLAFH